MEFHLAGDRVAGFVSRCQKHHKATAGKYYNTRPGKRDALIAKEIVTLLFGKVLECPELEEIHRMCTGELVQEWMVMYYRASRIKGHSFCCVVFSPWGWKSRVVDVRVGARVLEVWGHEHPSNLMDVQQVVVVQNVVVCRLQGFGFLG